MVTQSDSYAARLEIDYADDLDRVTTFFRIFWAIPILIILGVPGRYPKPLFDFVVGRADGHCMFRPTRSC